MDSKKRYLIVFFWIIFFTRFFDFILFSNRYVVYVLIIFLALFYFKSPKDTERIKSLVGIVTLLILCSCIYSFIHHHQPLLGVINASYFAFGLLFFCVLLYYELDYEWSLRLVINFSILFCACYIIQYLVYPYELFSGAKDEFSINMNQFRMRMTCSLCSYTLFLYGVNYLFEEKKVKYIAYVFIGFIPIIVMGFRSLIALVLLSVIYMFIKILGGKSLLSLLWGSLISIVMLLFALQTTLVQDKIEEMMTRQESDQTFDNDEYIRFISFAFYTTEVFTDPWERVVGGGVPIVSPKDRYNKTAYVRQVSVGYDQGLFWNDLGLIGLAFVIGPISTLFILFLMLRACWRCRTPELLFIKCAILVGVFGSVFTSQEIYRAGNFVFVALLMYTDYRCRLENNLS